MLKVAELAEPALARSRVNHETYRLILQQCYQAIQGSNNRNIYFARFVVPSSMPGRPAFEPRHATAYVLTKLLKGGFRACVLPPTAQLLHVQWDHARPEHLWKGAKKGLGKG